MRSALTGGLEGADRNAVQGLAPCVRTGRGVQRTRKLGHVARKFVARASAPAIILALAFTAGCGGAPRESFVQWVARDQWDQTCAEQAIVETWRQQNGRWKVQGEVWQVDVNASFKLVNACQSGLPLVGKSYKQFEVVAFNGTIEMSKCKKDGDTGWALPGKESTRCWTGPTLLGK